MPASSTRSNGRSPAGGKLVDQEKWKAAEHPFDAYPRLRSEALTGAKPKPEDNFRWRYHGLFYVAPAEDSYMCRLRIPNGILKHWQFAAVAGIAERLAGGYAHVTTRANLQIREIRPENGPAVVEELLEAGIVTKGAGADNVRNVTGSATAGIDPEELIDTRPHARAWHHHILNTRALYGLPRKFNVAFDGGGAVATLEETNDIGFQAVAVKAGGPVDAGVWYRLTLGGITGHKDFARDTGVILRARRCDAVADAIVRVFIGHGDRTNRQKARLKYLLDCLGLRQIPGGGREAAGRVLAEARCRFRDAASPRRPTRPYRRPPAEAAGTELDRRRAAGRQADGRADARARRRSRQDLGDGDIRLTVWQNLLLSGVPDAELDAAKARIEAAGLGWKTTAVARRPRRLHRQPRLQVRRLRHQGACARHRRAISIRVSTLDQPVNIHLTGCHHSCAQHYIGDIGLLGAKVAAGAEGDQVEGYHLHVGGGFGADAAIARLSTRTCRRRTCRGAWKDCFAPISRTALAERELRRILAPA